MTKANEASRPLKHQNETRTLRCGPMPSKVTEEHPWLRNFLGRGTSLAEELPWLRNFLGRGTFLAEELPWPRNFLGRGTFLAEEVPKSIMGHSNIKARQAR
eukprot:1745636-Pleurochrysis_carterae.AAC.1